MAPETGRRTTRHRLAPADGLSRQPLLLHVWEAMGRPRCHLTGGFVRDHLLGRPSRDLDFAVPESVEGTGVRARRLADVLGVRAHLLGNPPRSIWRVEGEAVKVELWPMQDLGLEADMRRRDFTCNALAWRMPDGPLLDRVQGAADIRARRLRAVARGNLDDDPIRCLRAARLLAQLEGFRIEAATARWIREIAPQLGRSPRERVGQELLALVRAARATAGCQTLVDLRLLGPCGPSPDSDADTRWLKRHADAADRLATGAGHRLPTALRSAGDAARLVPLLRAWRVEEDDAVASYGWPRRTRRQAVRAAALLEDALAAADAPATERRMLIHQAGGAFPALLAAAAALAPVRREADGHWRRRWRLWRRSRRDLVEPEPVLSAAEVADIAGVEPGPRLGRLLDALVRAQVRGEVRTAGGGRRGLRSHLRHEADRLPFVE